MRSQAGFSLVEVIIALSIVAIGIFGAAAMQLSSMRYSGQAAAINQLTRAAQGELEWRRQTATGSGSVGSSLACQSETADSITLCEVNIRPCILAPGSSEFQCSSGATSPIAYEIAVHVESAQGQTLTLRSVNTGLYYVAGVGGELSDPWVFPPEEDEDEDAPEAPITP